jgi:hypothetical protein
MSRRWYLHLLTDWHLNQYFLPKLPTFVWIVCMMWLHCSQQCRLLINSIEKWMHTLILKINSILYIYNVSLYSAHKQHYRMIK